LGLKLSVLASKTLALVGVTSQSFTGVITWTQILKGIPNKIWVSKKRSGNFQRQ